MYFTNTSSIWGVWLLCFFPSLLVMLHCLSRASSWSWTCLSLSVDPEDFLVSVGVIIFSYTSQIFLPPLEGSMEDRGQFDKMLQWTHSAACIMKTMFSLLVCHGGREFFHKFHYFFQFSCFFNLSSWNNNNLGCFLFVFFKSLVIFLFAYV